jgi:cell division septal protein FtsQ
MAGARSAARRQLVARRRARHRAERRLALDPALARRLVRYGLAAATALVLALVGWPAVRELVRTHPYFGVREVVVRRHRHLDPATIRALAGVEPGMNVWDVDVETVETRLLTNGWIRSAAVRREPPDRVFVTVREHEPIAILAVADETPGLYYLAANGRIFAPVGPGDARDLPYVTGLTRSDLAGSHAFGPRAVRRALVALRQVARHPAVGTPSELHVEREAGIVVMPVRPAVPIELGWGGYDEKLARVSTVLPLWAGREGEIARMSCLFDDEVIVRTRTAWAAPVATKGKGAGKPATGA